MSHRVEHASDPGEHQAGYLQATDFSLPYMSEWSRIHHHDREMLSCMNCSYLSTSGAPPTLLALKQHAQSLAVLIATLNPSVKSGRVGDIRAPGNAGDARQRAEKNEAFDWLQDLGTPYTNDDPNHHKPLNTLINEVKARHDVLGTAYHCALEEVPPRQAGEDVPNPYGEFADRTLAQPYASHHNLVMHANECLERLDHEFAATGGLLSLIPEEGQGENNEDLKAARNSLLGQLLTFSQHLTLRTAELEVAYGNALDALAGEAVVPMQHLSAQGPDARGTGREVAYPQDRWVLANAGDDVFGHLHDLLDWEEAQIEVKERIWRDGGMSGERTWARDRGGDEYARGIVPVNVNTRFYRLKGKGRNTIFVLPAWDRHPGVEHTRQMERTPKVVSVVSPRFPERTTELERRKKEAVERARKMEVERYRMAAENARLRQQADMASHERDKLETINRMLQAAVGKKDAQSTLAGKTQKT